MVRVSLGQKRKCQGSRGTFVLPSGADIVSLPQHVRLVPIADIKAHRAPPIIARGHRSSRTVNSAQSPSSLSTVMVPPCCCVTIS